MDQSIASTTTVGLTGVPPAPAHDGDWATWPELIIYDKHLSVGWEERPQRRGGPCYLVGRAGPMLGTKVVRRFPATDFGWAEAWHFLVGHDPTLVPQLTKELNDRAAAHRRRTEVAQLDALDHVAIKSATLLGGHLTGVDVPAGKRYDLRFLTDRLLVTQAQDFESLLDVPYSEVQEVEIGGPGLESALFRDPHAGLTMALGIIGEVIATTDTKIQTVVRVRTAAGELFFLDSTTLPDALRIQLSLPLAAIRAGGGTAARAAATVGELRALASMLESGLLTRAEFDMLKSGLLSGQTQGQGRGSG
jgi:hypothetical protein